MSIFQPGDKITRLNQNSWWKATCIKHNIPLENVFIVKTCNRDIVECYGWPFKATPENFTLVTAHTKEEIIAARIKKLYSKCKTTAHWV
jgi:hypothetical protein